MIQTTIDEFYLSRQRPRVSDLVTEVQRRCRTLGLPKPSRKAINLRIGQRTSVEVLAKRSGRKAARDRYGQATGFSDGALAARAGPDRSHAGGRDRGRQGDAQAHPTAVDHPGHRCPLRCVPGFHLSLDPPSATSVALCIAHAAAPEGRRGSHARRDRRRLAHCRHSRSGSTWTTRGSSAPRRCAAAASSTASAIDYRPVRNAPLWRAHRAADRHDDGQGPSPARDDVLRCPREGRSGTPRRLRQ